MVASKLWVMRSDGTDQVRVVLHTCPSCLFLCGGGRLVSGRKTNRLHSSIRGYLNQSSSLELTEWQSARRQIVFSDSRLGSALHWLPDGRLLYVLAEDASPGSDSNAWAITLRSAKINRDPDTYYERTGPNFNHHCQRRR